MWTSSIEVASLEQVTALARAWVPILQEGGLLFLEGGLGVGKTTFVQSLMQQWGYEGIVKSPTYTLVEWYPELNPPVVHADLYRLAPGETVDALGLFDWGEASTLRIIEWPERALGRLPNPDWVLHWSIDFAKWPLRRVFIEGLGEEALQTVRAAARL